MSPQDTVNEYFKILSGTKTEMLSSLVADNVTFDGPFFHARGADEFTTGMQQWMQLPKSYDMQQQFAAGDDICSLYEVTVTSPSGKTVVIPMADVIEVHEGKIVRERVYFDPTEWAQALGK